MFSYSSPLPLISRCVPGLGPSWLSLGAIAAGEAKAGEAKAAPKEVQKNGSPALPPQAAEIIQDGRVRRKKWQKIGGISRRGSALTRTMTQKRFR